MSIDPFDDLGNVPPSADKPLPDPKLSLTDEEAKTAVAAFDYEKQCFRLQPKVISVLTEFGARIWGTTIRAKKRGFLSGFDTRMPAFDVTRQPGKTCKIKIQTYGRIELHEFQFGLRVTLTHHLHLNEDGVKRALVDGEGRLIYEDAALDPTRIFYRVYGVDLEDISKSGELIAWRYLDSQFSYRYESEAGEIEELKRAINREDDSTSLRTYELRARIADIERRPSQRAEADLLSSRESLYVSIEDGVDISTALKSALVVLYNRDPLSQKRAK